jgi:diguanylate cyclase (GGDEF)-like protein/PAS domain S-box-containing protein/putative nucleotidyltransferase with HDIG domain
MSILPDAKIKTDGNSPTDEKSPNGLSISSPPLRALILEDDPRDAVLTASVLEGGGYKVLFEVTDSLEFFRDRLGQAEYDVILADFDLRNWSALDALDVLKHSNKDVPFIVVTGVLGDEAAAECIKQGAADFVLKDRLARLPTAVNRALEERRLRDENKRALEAQLRLATIVESSDDAIIGMTKEGVITSWNKGAEKLYGYPSTEILGHPVSALIPPDRSGELTTFLANLGNGARMEQFETVRLRKNGSLVDVLLSVFPLLDSRGKLTGVATIARDITERKRAEEKAQSTARQIKSILEAAGEGIYSVYGEGILTFVNPTASRILGYAAEELVGRGAHAIFHHSHPDGIPYPADDCPLVHSVLRTGLPLRCEDWYWRKDGSGFPVQVSATPIKESGNVVGAVVTFSDITEQKRAEEALRDQARRDPLTDLWNHKSILAILAMEVARASRTHTPVAIAMIDVDRFKTINDTYGHPAGDAVLQEASHRLRATMRTYDSLGRYGGDEFMAVFPGCDSATAAGFAESFRTRIDHQAIETPEGMIPMTLSVGVAELGDLGEVKSATLVRTADAALYRAKIAGRNRVARATAEDIEKGVSKRFLEGDLPDLETPLTELSASQPQWDQLSAASLETSAQHPAAEHAAALSNLESTCLEAMEALVTAIDARDHETFGHSHRVRAYTRHLAQMAGYPAELLPWLERGAFLHDIGKIAVSDAILRKPGPLTPEEWVEMRKHPEAGYGILRSFPFLRPVCDIVRHHHERFDGTGYPRGLKGAQIPRGARVFALADTLDAMTSDRPYRKALGFEVARNEILQMSATQFDPRLVEVFRQIPIATWMQLRAQTEKTSTLVT